MAHNADALSSAGVAALTLIEELELPADALSQAYEQAGEWLSTCQSAELWRRFSAAGRRVSRGLRTEAHSEEVLFNKPCNMKTKVLEYERRLISQALATSNGKVTHAAKWLGIGRQKSAWTIEKKHPDLLKERTPVRRRTRRRDGLALLALGLFQREEINPPHESYTGRRESRTTYGPPVPSDFGREWVKWYLSRR